MGIGIHAALGRGRGFFSLSHTILIVGVLMLGVVTVFGADGAVARKPSGIKIFVGKDDDQGTILKYGEFIESADEDFEVRPPGKKSDQTWTVTGVYVRDMLAQFDQSSAGLVTLSLDLGASKFGGKALLDSTDIAKGAILASSGEKPNNIKIANTPVLIPPERNSKDENGGRLVPFGSNEQLELRVYGGKKLRLVIHKRNLKNGEYKFSIGVKNPGDSGSKYKLMLLEGSTVKSTSTNSTLTTSGLANSTAKYQFVAEVSNEDDDYGLAALSFSTSKEDDGNTEGSTGSTGSTGNTGGSGSGSGSGSTGSTGSSGSSTYKPPKITTPPPISTLPDATVSTTDTSGLSQVVAGINGSGTYRAVSGVLLTTPATTSAQSGSSSSAGIERLASPVASAANDVFQPVSDPDDLWRFMLALLFASFVFGGIREYKKP